jgi:hypothetical protein
LYVDESGNFAVLAILAIAAVAAAIDIASGNAQDRYETMRSNTNLYTVGNWLTMGTFDMVKGTFAPDKPLSLEHWVNSAGTVAMLAPVANINFGAPKAGSIVGSTKGLTGSELKVVNDLKNGGAKIEIIPTSSGKTFDFKVNGVSTELKTLQNANVNTGVKRIYNGFQQNNPSVVIIDTRGTGLTTAQANEMISRAAGKYSNKTLPGQVQVWTDSGIVLGGKK